ncbi:hypothetical protein FA15DRAFT_709538 [Coprinopsis marcescibilis]|uniref:Uncharacterized protein n=1 Tax=Coprinopsis marcescibilis TaxID=230819 RepID=A0A5C3KFE3_COPMA|nr:hypothetical protein FA15DRAFT_709538 [Coprinopsis marcescibilis]
MSASTVASASTTAAPVPSTSRRYTEEDVVQIASRMLATSHPRYISKVNSSKSNTKKRLQKPSHLPTDRVIDAVKDKHIRLERDEQFALHTPGNMVLDEGKANDESKFLHQDHNSGHFFSKFQVLTVERAWEKAGDDDATEDPLVDALEPVVKLFAAFVLTCQTVEMQEQHMQGEQVDEMTTRLLNALSELKIVKKKNTSKTTTHSDLVWSWAIGGEAHYLGCTEVKVKELYTMLVVNDMELAIEGGCIVHKVGVDLKYKGGVTETCGPRIIGQVYEVLHSKGLKEMVLTCLYGACYVVRLAGTEDEPILKFSRNMIPEQVHAAAKNEPLRCQPGTYEQLCRVLLRKMIKGWAHLKENWETWDALAEERRAETQRMESALAQNRQVRMPWVTKAGTLLTDRLAIAAQVLRLDRMFNLFSFGIKMDFTTSYRILGDHTVVYVDQEHGLVFKRFSVEENYKMEILSYERLRGIDFTPLVLGTVSQEGWWGILMSLEGNSIPSEDLDDPSTLIFINRTLTILHDRQVHHHDIAARNILCQSTGNLVLIDIANGASDMECRRMEREDEDYSCYDKEALEAAAPSDGPNHLCCIS